MPFGGMRRKRMGGGAKRRRRGGGGTVGAQLAGLKTGRGMGGMGGRVKKNRAPAGKKKNRRRRGSSMR